MIVLSVVGIALIASIFDARHGIAFGTGSTLAYLSFLLIKRTVNAVSPNASDVTKKSTTAGITLRYIVIGATVFGIMRFTGISPWPVFAGLMTTVVAVLAEIVYELVTG